MRIGRWPGGLLVPFESPEPSVVDSDEARDVSGDPPMGDVMVIENGDDGRLL